MFKILYFIKQRKICKNCWYYHKNIKKCRLTRSTEASNVGMSVNKYDTCKSFIR
jgi:hypothetical protein